MIRSNIGMALLFVASTMLAASGCSPAPPADSPDAAFAPTEIIDLGALVTEDLPQRVWGRALLGDLGYTRGNSFDVITWERELAGGRVSGQNSYITLFNHGGPHVDAPNHMGVGEGLDSYAIEAFAGPLKVFDVSTAPSGRSVSVDVFRGRVEVGDIVLIYTGYSLPEGDARPEVATLTLEAAEYLVSLPVHAFGTDAFSVDSPQDTSGQRPSVHDSFLGRGIPAFEQLFNVDELLGKGRMYFVGAPLNIEDGDGMPVRPIVFVY